MAEFVQGNVWPLVSFIISLILGAGAFFTLQANVKFQATRLTAIENAITSIQNLLIKVAVQDERIGSMEQRSVLQGARIDDLTKGSHTRMDDLSRRIDANSAAVEELRRQIAVMTAVSRRREKQENPDHGRD